MYGKTIVASAILIAGIGWQQSASAGFAFTAKVTAVYESPGFDSGVAEGDTISGTYNIGGDLDPVVEYGTEGGFELKSVTYLNAITDFKVRLGARSLGGDALCPEVGNVYCDAAEGGGNLVLYGGPVDPGLDLAPRAYGAYAVLEPRAPRNSSTGEWECLVATTGGFVPVSPGGFALQLQSTSAAFYGDGDLDITTAPDVNEAGSGPFDRTLTFVLTGCFGPDRIPGAVTVEAEVETLDSTLRHPVKVQLQVLVSDVYLMNLKAGIANSLDGKLEAAVAALEDENDSNDVAALNALGAFRNYVAAQWGKQLSIEEAEFLDGAALEIIEAIEQRESVGGGG